MKVRGRTLKECGGVKERKQNNIKNSERNGEGDRNGSETERAKKKDKQK